MKFWDQDVKDVAQAMVGASLVVGSTTATILEAKPFRRRENERGVYKPMLEMQPGQIYCPMVQRAILILVTAKDGGQIGGCVLIRAVEVNGEIYQGPGIVSQRLGITEQRATGPVLRNEDGEFVIDPGYVPRPVERRGRRPNPRKGNGIGEKTIQAWMPKIVKKYTSEKPGIPFEDFLGQLLEGCKSEDDLRRALRS